MATTFISTRTVISLNDLYNRALAKIGSTRVLLNDINESSTIYNQIALQHGAAWSEFSRMHPWKDLSEWGTLNISSQEPYGGASKYNWYAIDSNIDYIHEIRYNQSSNPLSMTSPNFFVECVKTAADTWERGICILSADQDTGPSTIYVYAIINRDSNYEQLSPALLEAYIVYLASKLCVPINGNVEKQFELYKMFYETLLPEAKRIDSLMVNNALVDANNNQLTEEPFTFITYEKV